MIPSGYSLLSPITDTGLSRAVVFYKLMLTKCSTFVIFLEEEKNTPRTLLQDISAVISDLIEAGIDNPSQAIIVFKNGPHSYDGISIDAFGRADFYPLGAATKTEALQIASELLVRHK